MQQMTGYERIRIFKAAAIDRLGFSSISGDTHRIWTENGWIKPEESFEDHFNYDLQLNWAFDLTADLDFEPVTVEETDETILQRDGNGALLRHHKLHDSTPEHVDFQVKERKAWEEITKPKLVADRRRINFDGYRIAKEEAAPRSAFLLVGNQCSE
jgi:uroporphyrinogen decarboxylase